MMESSRRWRPSVPIVLDLSITGSLTNRPGDPIEMGLHTKE